MSQHITVVDYNPLWPKKYEEEALLIKDILADNCCCHLSYREYVCRRFSRKTYYRYYGSSTKS